MMSGVVFKLCASASLKDTQKVFIDDFCREAIENQTVCNPNGVFKTTQLMFTQPFLVSVRSWPTNVGAISVAHFSK